MTGQHCERARRLLGWSPEQFSERLAGHPSARAIRNFERHWKNIRMDNYAAILDEFEKAGIEFDADGRTVRRRRP